MTHTPHDDTKQPRPRRRRRERQIEGQMSLDDLVARER